MFDSREYEWADVTLVLGGRDVVGIRGVTYKEAIEREALYAKGRLPHSIQSGNISYEGKFLMLQSEIQALTKAGKGSLLNLRNIQSTCSYGDPATGDAPTTDGIYGIYFLSSEKDLKQGDKFMEVEVPFICLRIAPVE